MTTKLSQMIVLALIIFLPSTWAQAATGDVWYVKATGGAVQNGKSWESAFSSLQSALSSARKGDSIWVAKGIYYPDPNNRSVAFQLKEGVSVYGGFSGTESSVAQRDIKKNNSVLSGDKCTKTEKKTGDIHKYHIH